MSAANPIRLSFDVVVVGAGPAGIAAGVAAARSGARTALVDDNPAPGGQIWRAAEQVPERSPSAAAWFERLRSAAIHHIFGARVFRADGGVVSAETAEGVLQIAY